MTLVTIRRGASRPYPFGVAAFAATSWQDLAVNRSPKTRDKAPGRLAFPPKPIVPPAPPREGTGRSRAAGSQTAPAKLFAQQLLSLPNWRLIGCALLLRTRACARAGALICNRDPQIGARIDARIDVRAEAAVLLHDDGPQRAFIQ